MQKKRVQKCIHTGLYQQHDNGKQEKQTRVILLFVFDSKCTTDAIVSYYSKKQIMKINCQGLYQRFSKSKQAVCTVHSDLVL